MFCLQTKEFNKKGTTSIDNAFFTSFLPEAEPTHIKVYLYGLYLSGTNGGGEMDKLDAINSLEAFIKALKLSEDEVLDAFKFWESQGLVKVLNNQVYYLEVKDAAYSGKKYNKGKYTDFNFVISQILKRPITITEFNEYYSVCEIYGMEPMALAKIAKYCTNLKGETIGYHYITTLAKRWAGSGILTETQVDENLKEQEYVTDELKEILLALKIKRQANFEEKTEYQKWIKQFKFSKDIILVIAAKLKKASFNRLSAVVQTLNNLGLKTEKEVLDYLKSEENIKELTTKIVKNLGLYYESLDVVIETYVAPWLNKGFSEELLLEISKQCFKQGIRTLAGLNEKVNALFEKGILSISAYGAYANEVVKTDEKIKAILKVLGLNREVLTTDRSLYRAWAYSWRMDDDLIIECAKTAVGTDSPMRYLNKILSRLTEQKITTLSEFKNKGITLDFKPTGTKPVAQNYLKHNYSDEELNSVFANLSEFEGQDWK